MAMSPRLLRPRAPSGFNPRTLSGLSAWYDASVTSSVTLTGGFVSQWNDLSGNGINLSQSTEANRPGTATVNGRQAVDFDGSNDNLNNTTEVTPGTVFNVHIIDTSAGQSVYGVQSGSGATVRSSSLIFSSLGEYRSQSIASGFNAGFSGGSRTANPRISAHTFSGTAIAGRLDGAGFGGTTTTTGTNVNGVWLGIRNIGGVLSLPMDGKICEHLIYNRVLSDTEIATVERYLAAKWGVTLIVPPTASNADAQAWINNVYANGGTVSTATANAVNTFCNDIESAGIRDRFFRMNLFAGTGLSAALVPLFRGPSLSGTQYGNTTDTNNNFVSGDYVETGASTGGLKGNGSSKYLNTGYNPITESASNANFHLWIYTKDPEASGSTRTSIGTLSGSNELLIAWASGGTLEQGIIAGGSSVQRRLIGSGGLQGSLAITASSGRVLQAYHNGLASASGTETGTGSFPNLPIFVFSLNNAGTPGQYSLARYFRAYSIGQTFTATQAEAYHAALVTFQTALSRNV
jgi:hypothetical protein